MRPLHYSINVTLDGCCDHRVGVPTEAMHRYTAALLARADALILGRVTYEMMEAGWREPSPDMPAWTRAFAETINAARKHVVSRKLEQVDWSGAELVRGDPEHAVRQLKDAPGGSLYVGGVAFPRLLAEAGLIDEYELIVHPRIAGHGPYLLADLPQLVDLEPIGETDLGEGIVARRFAPRATDDR